jgi:hypothetical protein
MEIRTGLIQDIELLIDIDNDASTLFERAGLRLDSARDLEVTLAARRRWMKCLSAGTVFIAIDQSGEAKGFAAVGARDAAPWVVMRKQLSASVMPLTASSFHVHGRVE